MSSRETPSTPDGYPAAVRRFSRFITSRVGALDDHYLGQRRPLAEARLLFEIGESGRALRELRARLGLDSGYLARLLRSLEDQGLVTLVTDPDDRRSRVAGLTARGRREVGILDGRSQAFAAELLAGLALSDRARLVEAMGSIERLVRRAAVSVERADPRGADARHCLRAYAAELGSLFPEGYDVSELVSPDEIRSAGACLIARERGTPQGVGVLRHLDPDTDEIKHLWVRPDARGLGLARLLLAELESTAAHRGKSLVRLDTHHTLTAAIALYRSAGYAEVPPYGHNRHAALWFEKRLGLRTGRRSPTTPSRDGPPRRTS